MAKTEIIIDTNTWTPIRTLFHRIQKIYKLPDSPSTENYNTIWAHVKTEIQNNNRIDTLLEEQGAPYLKPLLSQIFLNKVKVYVPDFIYHEFVEGNTVKVTGTIKLATEERNEYINQNKMFIQTMPGMIEIAPYNSDSVNRGMPVKLPPKPPSNSNMQEQPQTKPKKAKYNLQEVIPNIQEFLQQQNLDNPELKKLIEHMATLSQNSWEQTEKLQKITQKYYYKVRYLDKNILTLKTKLQISDLQYKTTLFADSSAALYNNLKNLKTINKPSSATAIEKLAHHLAKGQSDDLEIFDWFDLKLFITAKERNAVVITTNTAMLHEIYDALLQGYFDNVKLWMPQFCNQDDALILPFTKEKLWEKLHIDFPGELTKSTDALTQIVNSGLFVPETSSKLVAQIEKIRLFYNEPNNWDGKNGNEKPQHLKLFNEMRILGLQQENGILKVDETLLLKIMRELPIKVAGEKQFLIDFARDFVHGDLAHFSSKFTKIMLSSTTDDNARLPLGACLAKNGRAKRNTCLVKWEDVDKYNTADDKRNVEQIQFDSTKFLKTLQNTPDVATRDQHMQILDEVMRSNSHIDQKIVGDHREQVKNLYKKYKKTTLLQKIDNAMSIVDMTLSTIDMAANIQQGNKQEIAIEIGQIFSEPASQQLSKIVLQKSVVLSSKVLTKLGKVGSVVIAAAPLGFNIYHFITQIQKVSPNDATAITNIVLTGLGIVNGGTGVIVSSIATNMASKTAAKLATKVALKIVTKAVPVVGWVITAIEITIDVVEAVKKVEEIHKFINLTMTERLNTGGLEFLKLSLPQEVQKRIYDKTFNNKLVENILESLHNSTQIEAYIVPTIEVVCAPSSAIAQTCDKYKIQNSEDQIINLESLGNNIQWSKVAPDDLEDGNQIGGFVCKPSGNGKAAPSGRYSECINSVGFKKQSNNPDLYWWIEIGRGNDIVTARLDKKTIVSMSHGDKKVKFGNKDDIARLSSGHITGELDGQQGDNLIDFHNIKENPRKFLLLALNNIELIFTMSIPVKRELIQGLIAIDYYGHNMPQPLNIKNFHLIMGGEHQAETILATCNTKDINSQGGKKYSTEEAFSYKADHIIIPSYYYGTPIQTHRVLSHSNCHYNMTLRVEGNTIVDNYAVQGNFTYSINNQNEVTAYLRYINITLYNHIQNQFQIKLPYIQSFDSNRPIVQPSPEQKISNTDLSTKVQHLFNFNHLTLTDITQMIVKFNGIISNIQLSFANNLQVNITDLNTTKSDSTYSFRDNSQIHLTKEGTYLVQYTNKSTQDVITNYPYNIVYRLGFPMIVFTGNNEVVYIGIGKDNIMRHVLTYPSHFLGSIGGKNTYSIEPKDEVLTMNHILSKITIYGSSRPEQMNILDLSDVVRKITQDLKTQTKLVSTKGQNSDILVSLWVINPNIATGFHNILVVKLSDAVASENSWCTKFRIILYDNNPMTVDCNTRDTHPAEVLYEPPSIPLSFNHEKIGIINSEHIEFNSTLIAKKNAKNYQFFYSGNNGVDLIITNIFDLNIEENEEYMILLKNFYKESNKMYTTTIRFQDKTISLQNETDAIEYSWPYYFQQKHFQANRYDILYLNELDTNVGHIPHRIRHHRHHEHHRDKREDKEFADLSDQLFTPQEDSISIEEEVIAEATTNSANKPSFFLQDLISYFASYTLPRSERKTELYNQKATQVPSNSLVSYNHKKTMTLTDCTIEKRIIDTNNQNIVVNGLQCRTKNATITLFPTMQAIRQEKDCPNLDNPDILTFHNTITSKACNPITTNGKQAVVWCTNDYIVMQYSSITIDRIDKDLQDYNNLGKNLITVLAILHSANIIGEIITRDGVVRGTKYIYRSGINKVKKLWHAPEKISATASQDCLQNAREWEEKLNNIKNKPEKIKVTLEKILNNINDKSEEVKIELEKELNNINNKSGSVRYEQRVRFLKHQLTELQNKNTLVKERYSQDQKIFQEAKKDLEKLKKLPEIEQVQIVNKLFYQESFLITCYKYLKGYQKSEQTLQNEAKTKIQAVLWLDAQVKIVNHSSDVAKLDRLAGYQDQEKESLFQNITKKLQVLQGRWIMLERNNPDIKEIKYQAENLQDEHKLNKILEQKKTLELQEKTVKLMLHEIENYQVEIQEALEQLNIQIRILEKQKLLSTDVAKSLQDLYDYIQDIQAAINDLDEEITRGSTPNKQSPNSNPSDHQESSSHKENNSQEQSNMEETSSSSYVAFVLNYTLARPGQLVDNIHDYQSWLPEVNATGLVSLHGSG